MGLQAIPYPLGLRWWKGGIQRSGGMRVEMIQDDHNVLRLREMAIDQLQHLLCPVHGCSMSGDLNVPPVLQRSKAPEQIAEAIAFIRAFVACRVPAP